MRALLRWALVVLVIVHGLIHLMGTFEGLGWADVEQLSEPVGGAVGGVAWLVAATAVSGAAVLLAAQARAWWVAMAVAAVLSQVLVITAWADAKAGTVANVVMLAAAGYGYLRRTPGPAPVPHPDEALA